MKELKHRLFTNWSFIRAFYLLMGLLILGSSIPGPEWLGILFGAYVCVKGLFGFGCAAGYCAPVSLDKNGLELQTEGLANSNQESQNSLK